MAHDLRQLHFAQFVELAGLEHARLDLADSLREHLVLVDLDALRLHAVGTEELLRAFMPGVNFQVMLATESLRLQEGLTFLIAVDAVRNFRVIAPILLLCLLLLSLF